MRLTITIDTENDALVSDPVREVERLLLATAAAIKQGHTQRAILDLNGNTVGSFSYGP